MKVHLRRLTLPTLVAATYFMVAGGPYGLEELVASAGARGAIVALLVTPLVWSLPTTLMVGELASALPEEGGYYAWVRRAMGPFWGFQEAWLSLVASFFDMAIYPTLFTLYLGGIWPEAAHGPTSIALGAAVIAACAAWNLRGAGDVGRGAVVLGVVMLAPFAVLTWLGFRSTPAGPAAHGASSVGILGAVEVAIWNYMGWDYASTVAGEVERPQRNYPVGMIATLVLVAFTYVVPVAAVGHAGLDTSRWTTGSWVDAARLLGGPRLAFAIVVCGLLSGLGLFSALVLSYSRLPLVLAEDGYLPRWLAKKSAKTGTPWASVLACSAIYAACLGFGFDRLVELDVLLYGLSLLLEFAALVVLRVKEPGLPRPFRVPGGLAVAVLLGVGPLLSLCLVLAGASFERENLGLALVGGSLVLLGPVVYWVSARRGTSPAYRPS